MARIVFDDTDERYLAELRERFRARFDLEARGYDLMIGEDNVAELGRLLEEFLVLSAKEGLIRDALVDQIDEWAGVEVALRFNEATGDAWCEALIQTPDYTALLALSDAFLPPEELMNKKWEEGLALSEKGLSWEALLEENRALDARYPPTSGTVWPLIERFMQGDPWEVLSMPSP
ncbi:MAG: hypothetical protein ABR575_07600 [Actinomycetota bacterium]